jgi:hypothetical protein
LSPPSTSLPPTAAAPVEPSVPVVAPPPYEPHEVRAGDYGVAVVGDYCRLDVDVLGGATFVRSAPRDAGRDELETDVAEELESSGLVDPTRTNALRIVGRWPSDAWAIRPNDLAHWTGAAWQTRPTGPGGFVVDAAADGTLLIANTVTETLADGRGRGCIVAQSTSRDVAQPSLLCGAPMASAPFAGGTVIPFEDGICQLALEGVDLTPAGEVEVVGRLCALHERAVWRGGRWRSLAAPPPPPKGTASRTVFGRLGADAYALRTTDFDTSPRAIVYACTDTRCTKLAERPLEGETYAYTPLAMRRAEDGALLLWAGHELARWKASGWESELPAPVTSVAPDHGARYATAHGMLFERASDGHWKELALPTWEGVVLHAERVVFEHDQLWIVASYDNGGCHRGSIVLRAPGGPPTLYCRKGKLATVPSTTDLRSVIQLGNGMRWATLDALATLPPELTPHLRVVRVLGRGFTNQLAVDPTDETTRQSATAFAKKYTPTFPNPLCVDPDDLGPLTDLPPDWRTLPDAGAP